MSTRKYLSGYEKLQKKRKIEKQIESQSAEESFRMNYFVYTVDQAISSIESRFENFQIYEDIFGFLLNFEKLKALDNKSLKK